MDTLTTFLSEQTIERIGWVLIHFLWQGIAVMLLSWCGLKTLRKASANARYIAACASLLLMVAAPAATFVILTPNAPLKVAYVQMPDALSVSPAAAPVPATTQTIAMAPAEPIPLPAPSLIETVFSHGCNDIRCQCMDHQGCSMVQSFRHANAQNHLECICC